MYYIFSGCKSLKLINLSNFNLENRKNINLIFDNISNDCNIICQNIKGTKKEIIKFIPNKIFPSYFKKYNKMINLSTEEFDKLENNDKRLKKINSK